MFEKKLEDLTYEEALWIVEIPKMLKETQIINDTVKSLYPELQDLRSNEKIQITGPNGMKFDMYLTNKPLLESREQGRYLEIDLSHEGLFEFLKKRYMIEKKLLQETEDDLYKNQVYNRFLEIIERQLSINSIALMICLSF